MWHCHHLDPTAQCCLSVNYSSPFELEREIRVKQDTREFLADTTRWFDKQKYWSTLCHFRLFLSTICRKPKPPRVHKLWEPDFPQTPSHNYQNSLIGSMPSIASIIISCSWTLTSLSHAIIWQVRNGERDRTQRQQRERERERESERERERDASG